MSYEIDRELWSICKICQKTIKDIKKTYGGGNNYFSKSFLSHLKYEHDIDPTEYFNKYCNLEIPLCPCGQCNKPLRIICDGAKIRWNKFACGRNPGQQAWSEQAKESRKGENNPMYGKTPWNQGLTKEINKTVKNMAEKSVGRKTSEETRKKQSESAKKRLIHGHSEETKELFRKITLERIRRGDFKQNQTKPFLEFRKILEELDIKFEEEKTVHYWSFDFYLLEYDIYVEVDGDYWHSNPKMYPDGPKTKTQKINWYRDIKKNKYCQENNLSLLRFWECDIINNTEEIKCKLKELLQLKRSA